jgi:hypothetical protein
MSFRTGASTTKTGEGEGAQQDCARFGKAILYFLEENLSRFSTWWANYYGNP